MIRELCHKFYIRLDGLDIGNGVAGWIAKDDDGNSFIPGMVEHSELRKLAETKGNMAAAQRLLEFVKLAETQKSENSSRRAGTWSAPRKLARDDFHGIP